ncbi:MAG: sugar phosphate nucleotidyltransferase, partial [Candidatus Uhrbacteria bacterium]
EKPTNPPSNFAQTGIYVYSPAIFDAVSAIQPSARGEYEISDANTYLIEHGYRVGWAEMTGWWKDTGKPEDLLEGNQLILTGHQFPDKREEAIIRDRVTMQGHVNIGKGSTIGENVLIRGPVVIGEGCTITNSYIGPYTSIGDRVTIDNTEIEHSIVFDDAAINAHKRIVDSIIGHHAAITPVDLTLPLGHKLIIGDNSAVEV